MGGGVSRSWDCRKSKEMYEGLRCCMCDVSYGVVVVCRVGMGSGGWGKEELRHRFRRGARVGVGRRPKLSPSQAPAPASRLRKCPGPW